MTKQDLEKYFISFGVREFQAKKKSSQIVNWDGVSELGTGAIYTELREIGVGVVEAYKIEALFWAHYDKIHGTTPWEAGLLNFIEGRSKLRYNQIPLI